MALLRNPRHEKFSQLVASGIKPTEAYVSLGYSEAGAAQSANKLLKRADVRARVDEILSAAAHSIAEQVAFDHERVLKRLDVLSRRAEELGQIAAAARCEELIGKYSGMFVNHAVEWDGDLKKLTMQQLVKLRDQFRAIAEAGSQRQIAAGPVIDMAPSEGENRSSPGS